MKKVLIICSVLLPLFAGMQATASKTLDINTVDALTYRYYMQKNWDSVIVIGKEALRQDIDFFYLRVRMGIAYFERTDYFPATTHLEKARQFTADDAVVNNYLYHAYLYTNRPSRAGKIRHILPNDSPLDPAYNDLLVQEIHAGAGYTVSSDRSPDNLSTLMGSDSIYGQQDLYGNSTYSNLGLKLRLSPGAGLSLAFSYLTFDKTTYIQYGHTESRHDYTVEDISGIAYYYTYPWIIRDTSFNYKVTQYEGHIGGSFMIPGEIKVTPALHAVNVSYPRLLISMADSASDTAYFRKSDNTYQMFRYRSATYSYLQRDTSFTNWVISLGLSRQFGRVTVALEGSWSNLNGKKQKQAGISATYYPLGNLNLYGTTTATGFFQKNDKRLLLSQVIGGRITPWMWGEANIYYGDYTGANIFNGSVVYNNTDLSNYRTGAALYFIAGKHLRFTLVYQYFSKESRQYYYIKQEDPATHEINEVMKTKTNPYTTHSIIGGITWKL